ncbi:MAG TPA: hypothetical protein VGZ48_08645 [Candidatus Acidoferrales bacterium]|nr:hypothetical protein [Candidatus Acidoferrales bacterium]
MPNSSRRPRSLKKVIARHVSARKSSAKKTTTRRIASRRISPRKNQLPARAANPKSPAVEAVSFDWIRPLAEPYLRGFRAKAENANGLRGFSFSLKPRSGKSSLGFFVGFLTGPGSFAHLKPAAPECLIFAFIEPIGGSLHRAQVRDANGALRWTSGYIRWLTHRPPRFEFYESERTALIRHASMRGWPAEKIQHFAGNFFTETLAWLVRSGLVRRWRELSITAAKN